MNIRVLILPAALGSILFAQESSPSKSELNQGVADYKSGRYQEAVTHFQRAVDLNPADLNARLYLATAYYIQWVPGQDDHPENLKKREMAAKEFEAVLDKDARNPLALAMMASMMFNRAQSGAPEERAAALDEAADWNRRRIAVDPNDAEPYYYLGVIDWAKLYGPIQRARIELHMSGADPGPIKDSTVRASLQTQFGSTLQDGLANLQRCLEIDPQNEDAMTYLNLLLRKKADLEDSAETAQTDMAEANDWADKALETKKRKAEPAVPAAEVPTLRISGREAEKNVISKVQPVYPSDAQVQGSVEFTIVIDTQGNVESIQLVQGHPLLVSAAKDAVRQWKYRPFLLKGQAVKTMTNVVINFTLTH